MKKHLNPKQTVFDTFQGIGNTFNLYYTLKFSLMTGSLYINDKLVKTPVSGVGKPIVCTPDDAIRIDSPRTLELTTTTRAGQVHAIEYDSGGVLNYTEMVSISLDAKTGTVDPFSLTIKVENTFEGVFSAIKASHSDDFDVDVTGLDEEYLIGHSKHKAPSTELETYALMFGTDIELEDGERLRAISSRGLSRLAEHIWSIYGLSWTRIYDALIAEYEPIENYNMEEIETPDLLTTHEVSEDYSLTDEHAVSDDYKLTDTEKRASKVKTENDNLTNESLVKAFNSSDYVGANKNVATGSTTTTGLENDNKTTNERTQVGSTSDKHTQTGSTSESQTGTRTLTRHGNIGVTTNQQMLTSEVELRVKTQMWSIMMADADKVLSAPSYHEGLTEVWL